MKGDEDKMKNMNPLKVAKGVGLLLSIGGMLVTSIVNSKENEKVLEKLVEKHLQK